MTPKFEYKTKRYDIGRGADQLEKDCNEMAAEGFRVHSTIQVSRGFVVLFEKVNE